MNALTQTVEQYKSILPDTLYLALFKAAEEVEDHMIAIMEPAFRIELHKACDTYFQALKSIGRELQEEKRSFLLETEQLEKQRELGALGQIGL